MDRRNVGKWFWRIVLIGAVSSCFGGCASVAQKTLPPTAQLPPAVRSENLTPFQKAIVSSLEHQTEANTVYDSSYYRGGVPPSNVGVCSDVAIRAFAAAGVDLKSEVTTDIKAHQRLYPLTHPDPNIDHRRCRNLAVYFQRHAKELPISADNAHWQPGDIVFWSTKGKSYVDHIGVVGNHIGASGNPTVVQHVPGGYVHESDTLYGFQVMNHFRWTTR